MINVGKEEENIIINDINGNKRLSLTIYEMHNQKESGNIEKISKQKEKEEYKNSKYKSIYIFGELLYNYITLLLINLTNNCSKIFIKFRIN